MVYEIYFWNIIISSLLKLALQIIAPFVHWNSYSLGKVQNKKAEAKTKRNLYKWKVY